jgi:hypothetical protein
MVSCAYAVSTAELKNTRMVNIQTHPIFSKVHFLQATIVVNVTDSNDNRPIFSIPPGGYMENILENATVGSEVIVVTATDLDQGANQVITYSILANSSLPFSIPDPTVSEDFGNEPHPPTITFFEGQSLI